MNEKNIKTCLVGAEIKDYSIHYCHFDSRKKYNEEYVFIHMQDIIK